MQNHLRKSSNNTLDSLVCEIKSNLDKTVHFIVKETHRLHHAELDIGGRTWHRKIDIVLFSMFHHSAPGDNHA